MSRPTNRKPIQKNHPRHPRRQHQAARTPASRYFDGATTPPVTIAGFTYRTERSRTVYWHVKRALVGGSVTNHGHHLEHQQTLRHTFTIVLRHAGRLPHLLQTRTFARFPTLRRSTATRTARSPKTHHSDRTAHHRWSGPCARSRRHRPTSETAAPTGSSDISICDAADRRTGDAIPTFLSTARRPEERAQPRYCAWKAWNRG